MGVTAGHSQLIKPPVEPSLFKSEKTEGQRSFSSVRLQRFYSQPGDNVGNNDLFEKRGAAKHRSDRSSLRSPQSQPLLAGSTVAGPQNAPERSKTSRNGQNGGVPCRSCFLSSGQSWYCPSSVLESNSESQRSERFQTDRVSTYAGSVNIVLDQAVGALLLSMNEHRVSFR